MTKKTIPIIEDKEILIEDDIKEKTENQAKAKKSVAEKKNEKRIMRLAGKAIAEFGMIEGGDKVMVCMSGGKDSYVLLDVLMKLQKRAPVPFELIALHVDQHLPNFPKDVIPDYLESIGVNFHIEDQDTWSIVQRVIPDGKNVCSVCSRLRRGIIYRVAKELGVTKIALGHHMDDIVSTLLLNMFYGGRLKGMPPILRSDDGQNVIIRPLAYVREYEIERWVKYRNYPIISKEICRKIENKKRAEIKALMRDWDRQYDSRIYNILMSMTRVAPSHLMDKSIYDFKTLIPDALKKENED
jgi:tRNA 2-thiocytidine biosynthesis protein TtcA